jgi:hypothetical protein
MMTAEEKIESLVDPDLLSRIPSFVRGHAIQGTAKLIAREHPALYAAAGSGMGPEQESELREIVNGIYRERMAKHGI